MKTTELQFKDEQSYDEKVDIEIRLLKARSSEDYKTIVDSANLILETAGKYIDHPAQEKKKVENAE